MRDVRYCVVVCSLGLVFCAVVAGMNGGAQEALLAGSIPRDAVSLQEPAGAQQHAADVVIAQQQREPVRRALPLKRL